jgi:flagellar protein FliO/FliZ
MDNNLGLMLLQILVALPFVLFLIYFSLKFGGTKLQQLQNGKFIKILERVPVSKENSLVITKIGKKGYIIASTNSKLEILMELDEEDIKNIEDTKPLPPYDGLNKFYKNSLLKRKDKSDKKY